MGVTFVHTGDAHLGSPLRAISGASEDMGNRLARATQRAFRRVVTVALDHDVDFVVVAGDLYDREARSVTANQFLVEQFERLDEEGVRSYVVHGNHDPLGQGAEKLDFPDSVHVFGTDTVGVELYPDEGDPSARILGQSYSTRHESNRLYYQYVPDDTSIPNVGVLHTGLNPEGRRYAPCAAGDLATKDVDYWALGHIHETRLLDAAPAAYCGIPQGRHVGEPGVGGCLLVELEAGERPDIEFHPTSPLVWQDVPLDVTTAGANGDSSLRNLSDLETYVEDRAIDLAEAELDELVSHDIPLADSDWEPEGYVCRWTLTGRGEIHGVLGEDEEATDVLTERLRNRLDGSTPLIWTERVRDRTSPPLPDRKTLAEEDEVIAELLSLTEDVRDDSEGREELRGRAGEVWEWVDDPDREDTRPDRIALYDDRLDDLIDHALTMAIDELASRRYNVD